MPKFSWRLIYSRVQSGAMNMAVDDALLEAVAAGNSPPLLRLYQWEPKALTLGYSQNIERDINQEACREEGVDIIRRSTGGRAVLHAKEVTYSVIARNDAPPFDHSILDCYRVIAKILQGMLLSLNIVAELVPGVSRCGEKRSARAVCFSVPSQWELVVEGRKVVGSAQRRLGKAFLQHGSIPLEMDLDLLSKILRIESSDRASLEKIGWLNLWTEKALNVDQVEKHLISSFRQHLNVTFEKNDLTEKEQARAEILHENRFSNIDWTMKR